MINVIKTGGKQYKVSKGDKLKIEKIAGKEGDSVEFDQVLLKSDEKGTKVEVGTPFLKEEKVKAKILKQGKSKKIRVVKYKAKVRYHKVYGHRQAFTEVQIAQ